MFCQAGLLELLEVSCFYSYKSKEHSDFRKFMAQLATGSKSVRVDFANACMM
jgi:hypothetical protein